MRSSSRSTSLAVVTLSMFVSLAGPSGPALAELTFEVVKSFESTAHLHPVSTLNGYGLSSSLVLGSDGSLYGVTHDGGSSDMGTVFRIDGAGNFTGLHSFSGADGAYPTAALIPGRGGVLYGTTLYGGSPGGGTVFNGGGTVFRLDSAGTFTSLHSFTSGTLGYGHTLVPGSDGALYGSTRYGGSYGAGMVFKIDSSGTFTTLHSFNYTDSWFPSTLVLGSDGALYGVATAAAGSYGGLVLNAAMIFKIDAGGTFTSFYTFRNGDGGPIALVPGSDGALYGLTYSSSFPISSVSVFRIDRAGTFTYFRSFHDVTTALVQGTDGTLYVTTSTDIIKVDGAGNLTTLRSFSGKGWYPIAALWSDGVLYGTVYTSSGTMVFGIDDTGAFTHWFRLPDDAHRAVALGSDGEIYGTTPTTVFRIDSAGTLTSLHSFTSADGDQPSPALVLGSDGAVYGTTTAGGSSDLGTIFRIDPAGSFTPLHSFSGWPGMPYPHFLLGSDGALYGLRVRELFRIDTSGTVTSMPVRGPDGSELPPLGRYGREVSPAVLGADGALYWTESLFPDSESGVPGSFGIFKADGAGNGTVLHLESGDCYWSPGLVLGSDGALYGTCERGGSSGVGTVFRIDSAGSFTTLHSFVYTEGGYALDGAYPSAALALGSDGALYGTTHGGGSFGAGTVFKIDSAGVFASLHSFDGRDGAYPSAALALGSDGALYGTCERGGPSGVGTVFRIDRAGNFTALHSFSGTDGIYPSAALVLGSDGALYGGTSEGGSFDAGTAFKIDSAGTFSSLHSFDGTDGAYPFGAWPSAAPLLVGSDCALYGTAARGGPGGGGVVYRLFEAGYLCQRVRFDPLPDRTLRDPAFTVSATASSGLPVSFSASGRCRLSGDQVFLKRGVGICRVTAYQAGDSRFGPAPELTQEFRVGPPRRTRSLRWEPQPRGSARKERR